MHFHIPAIVIIIIISLVFGHRVHAVCTKAPSTVVATNINNELSKIKKEGMDNHLQCSDIVDLIDLHTDTSIKTEDLGTYMHKAFFIMEKCSQSNANSATQHPINDAVICL